MSKPNKDRIPMTATGNERFHGKVALITGASDRGIGGAIAERLVQEGASVGLLSRSEPTRLLKRLERRSAQAVWIECDLTDSDQIQASVDLLREHFESVDVVVNSAGIEMAGRIEDLDRWREVIDVNLGGTIEFTRLTLPFLREPGGAIVNITSALALGGCAGFSVYSASKAGVVGLTQSLAWELAPRGIRVVAVAPGLVHTPMLYKHVQHYDQEVERSLDQAHPLGLGLSHDVAAAVAFLASEEARWITGVTLPLGWAHGYALPTEPFLNNSQSCDTLNNNRKSPASRPPNNPR